MRVRVFAIVLTLLALLAVQASAQGCRTVTIMQNGRVVICSVCDFGAGTTINCF